MNVLSELKSEGLRTVFTFLVPGGTAAAPWICVVVHFYPSLSNYGEAHPFLSGVLLLLIALSAGKVVDGLGSWWEVSINDRLLKKQPDYSSFDSDWNRYLRMAFPKEPVGARYIRDVRQSLKFELNQGIAVVLLWIGFVVIALVKPTLTCAHVLVAAAAAAIFAGFLLWDSYGSSKILAHVRRELSKGVIVNEGPIPGEDS